MTTDHGRAFVLQRLNDAPDLDSLRRVFASLSYQYQRDEQIIAVAKALAAGHKQREAKE